MGRIVSAADGSAGNATAQTVTATISGANRFTILAINYRSNGNTLDTITYGSGNTVYDSGGDTSALISSLTHDPGDDHTLHVLRIFEGNHPGNGSVTVTFNFSASVRGVAMIVQYDEVDQTTGYRGTPQTTNATSGTAWDLSGITEDSADIETLGIIGAEDATQTHTPDGDNPELFEAGNGGSGGPIGVGVSDTASRATLGGDFSVSNGFAAWGASILVFPSGHPAMRRHLMGRPVEIGRKSSMVA